MTFGADGDSNGLINSKTKSVVHKFTFSLSDLNSKKEISKSLRLF